MMSRVSVFGKDSDQVAIENMEHVLSVKSAVLELRNQYQLSPKESIPLTHTPVNELAELWSFPGIQSILRRLANATISGGESNGVGFIAGKYQYFAGLSIKIDKAAELKKMEEELAYYKGFVQSVDKKLSNEKFVANASADVVEKERQKKADGESKIEQLVKSIEQLK